MPDEGGTRHTERIRITKAELDAPHVDDLLKRQASLRGEGGLTRERRSAWYHRSYVVLAIAGMLGALAAWALVEPAFDDLLYVQGVVESVDLDTSARMLAPGERRQDLAEAIIGTMTIQGMEVLVSNHTLRHTPDGKEAAWDPAAIDVGAEVGVFLDQGAARLDDRPTDWYVCRIRTDPPASANPAEATFDRQSARHTVVALMLFPITAGCVGLLIGAADGIACRVPRRAVLGGSIGLIVGLIGGFLANVIAGLVYGPLSAMALSQTGSGVGGLSTWGFALQLMARGIAWGIAGTAMGLGQGIALRSGRLALYGLLGGVIGGVLGGLLFDPIYFFIQGEHELDASLSRAIGLVVIGGAVGAMIGIVELLARDAWLRMTEGPLAGKEFLIFKDVMRIGASPRSDIYLFNDAGVAPQHAVVRTAGDVYELECTDRDRPLRLNGHPIQRSRLRHGDRITLGRTAFLFQSRGGN